MEFERVDRLPSHVMVEGHEEYEVEKIVRHKGKGARHLYQVLWKGFPITEASWAPESHLANAPQVLEEYLHRVAAEDKLWRRRSEEAPQPIDGVLEDSWGRTCFIGMGTTFVGMWCRGEIAFGAPNLPWYTYSLYAILVTNTLKSASEGAGTVGCGFRISSYIFSFYVCHLLLVQGWPLPYGGIMLCIVELWRILQWPGQLGSRICLSWDGLGILYNLECSGDTLEQTFHALYIIMGPLHFGTM